MWNGSIWAIDRTLWATTTPGQSAPGSDGNEGVLRIPLNSSVTGALPSDYLVSYLGHRVGAMYICEYKHMWIYMYVRVNE